MLVEQDKFMEALYKEHFGKLARYASATLGNSGLAEELAQDTFHELVLHIDALMTHENPGGWLMETLKYKIKTSERTRRRYLHRFISLDYLSIELVPPRALTTELRNTDEPSPLQTIEAALTEEEYRFLIWLTLDKVSHLEMAQELGITV